MSNEQPPPAGDFGSTDGLGCMVPTRANVDALMKRCQIGVGGRHALDDAHSIMAECYGTLGALMLSVERIQHDRRDLITEREYLIVENAQLLGALDALLEVAEQVVDTRRCSVGILRAMNTARKHVTPNVPHEPQATVPR